MQNSQTARTDAHQDVFNAKPGFELDDVLDAYELARTLERENQQLREALKLLRDAIPDWDWNFIALDDGTTGRRLEKALGATNAALAAYQSLSQGGKG